MQEKISRWVSQRCLFQYHPRMWVGNVFSHVCLTVCVCLCVCLCVSMSVCLCVVLSVQAITFEPLHIETSFLECRYVFTISRSNLSIKVIVSWSRSHEKKWKFLLIFNLLILCMWLHVINKVKVTHQGEGHIKVKVKISTSFPKTFKKQCTIKCSHFS